MLADGPYQVRACQRLKNARDKLTCHSPLQVRVSRCAQIWTTNIFVEANACSFNSGPYDKDQCMYNGTEDIDVNTGNIYDTRVNEWCVVSRLSSPNLLIPAAGRAM